ncbi:MAG: hypothetical protein ACYCYF_05140 [Anaerolineae bacterium]
MRRLVCIVMLVCILLPWPGLAAHADCPGNLALNAGFEDDWYAGTTVGTSLSSFISGDWLPWAVLGDPTTEEVGYNFEPEYKILQRSVLLDGWYRVYAGERAQAFFSMYSTHTAGFYQRIAVPSGSTVTFSIWVQIYTGQEDLIIDGRYPVSDLVQPESEPTRSVKGPGDYRVYVGIDPYGSASVPFGEPIPTEIVWSEPVLDVETRGQDAAGKPVDEWVQLKVTTRAQSDHVTVYTKGQPAFRTKHNDSYWDEACVQVAGLATATLRATAVPPAVATPRPTATRPPAATVLPSPVLPSPTASVRPSQTPLPPVTPIATMTPAVTPTATASPASTATEEPKEIPTLRTATITLVPSATASPVSEQSQARPRAGLVLLYLLNGALIVAVLWWIRAGRRQ